MIQTSTFHFRPRPSVISAPPKGEKVRAFPFSSCSIHSFNHASHAGVPELRPTPTRLPVITLFLTISALAVALFPACAPSLIYNRPAILSGELWRMFTSHWVHFSLRHLIYDLVPLVTACWIMETRHVPGFRWFCALAPWTISAALLLFTPQMQYCGGLSGLGTGALVLLALWGLSEPSPVRAVCRATLLIIAGKTIFELVTGASIIATFSGQPVKVSVASHLAGAATACWLYRTSHRRRVCENLQKPR